jgi:hypothetical protein
MVSTAKRWPEYLIKMFISWENAIKIPLGYKPGLGGDAGENKWVPLGSIEGCGLGRRAARHGHRGGLLKRASGGAG